MLAPGVRELLVAQHRDATAREIQVGREMLEFSRVSGEGGIRMPPELTMLGKTLLQLDEVGRALDPKFDPNAAIRRNAAEIIRRRMLSGISPGSVVAAAMEAKEFVQELPGRTPLIVVEIPAFTGTGSGSAPQDPRSSGLRHALIVDDEPDVAGSLADILELMGVKSQVITKWTSASEVLADHDPEIVFSDLRMPEASGMTIYRELTALRPDLASRFVLVTGDMMGARSAVEQLATAERPLVLEKPFSTLDVRGVLAAVNEAVGRR